MYLAKLYHKDHDKRKLIFFLAFLATTCSYTYTVLEAFNIDTGLLGLRFFDWTSVPIIIAVFIAANDYLLKPKNYNSIFNGFTFLFALCFLIPLIPIDTLTISSYFRMFVAIEINLAALFGFIKTRNVSFLLFIFSMMSLAIGGMSFLIGEDNVGIFANVIGLTFLGLIFFIPQKETHGVSAYFSIEEKLKDAEKALTESESRYSRIFNSAKDGFLIFDLEGNIVDANQKALEMYQYSRSEFLKLSGKDIVHPDYQHLFGKFKNAVIETGEFQTESTDIKKDGSPFDVEIRGTDIEYDGKRHLLAIVRDISLRKQAEKELQNSQRQLSTLLDNLPGMAYQCLNDDHWTMTYVSTGCKALTEYSSERIIGNKDISYAKLIHIDDQEFVKNTISDAVDNKKPFQMMYRIHTKSGLEKWVWEQGICIFSDEDKLLDLEGFITDITEWKKADVELQKLASFASDYVSLPLDRNLYKDLCQKIKSLIGPGIVAVNKIEDEETMYLESIEGIDEKRLDLVNKLLGPQKIGKPISHIDKNAKEMLTKGMMVEVPNGVSGLFFGKIPSSVGKAIEKLMHIKNLYSIGLRHEDNLFGNVVIVSTDATSINKNSIEVITNQAAVVLDKRRAWKELQQAHQKIQSMNEMLEGKVQERTKQIEKLLKQKDEFINQLGHDLKNPLGPLINLLPIIENHTANEKDKEILQVIQRNVGYMKNLVQKTLELARLNSPNTKLSKSWFSLNDLVYQIISQNKYLFEENKITVTADLAENMTVNADKLRIEELLNNLLNNAVKYSEEFGSIIISANKHAEAITISIKDTGIGMSADQITHVFDEFYKADESRHDFDSSGLGMAICKRIVEKHGGEIWAESDGIGSGTTIYFTLPLSSDASTEPLNSEPADDSVYQKIDSLIQDF